MKWYVVVAMALLWTLPAHGTTRNAASCSSSDVQTAINASSSGDTVVVPSGSCTWSSQVTATGGVIIQGQTVCNGAPGVQVTSCTDNTNITLAYSNYRGTFYISGCSASAFCTLTGVTFINAVSQIGSIVLTGTHGQVSFRVHHCHFKNSGGVMLFEQSTYGLNDHLLFDDTSAGAVPFNFDGDFASRGYQNWTDPTNPGSNEAIYVEDSLENMSGASNEGFFDAYAGAKIVIRYNTLNGNNMGGGHGTDSGNYRSVVWYEIYNNNISSSPGNETPLMNTRGGTVIFFNNVVTGSTPFYDVALQYFRISQQIATETATWGDAGPALNWTPISATPTDNNATYNTLNAADWQAGHSYAANAVVGPRNNNAGQGGGVGGYNFQTSSSCTSGGTYPGSWNQTVGGTTSDGGCTWMNVGGGTATSAGGASVAGFCAANPDTPASSNAACAALVPGDTASRHFDSDGGVYPFRDQPGRTHNQVLTPNYAWNNSGSNLPNPVFGTPAGTASVVVEGRDYYNNTAMPGYAPYTYPHPLQSSSSPPPSPAAPTGLSATVQQ